MQYMSRVLVENAECMRRFGTTRPRGAYSAALSKLPEQARSARRKWLMAITQALPSAAFFGAHLCASFLFLVPK